MKIMNFFITYFLNNKLPFILDIDMVLEFGGVKVAVTQMFPNPQFPRRHNEVHHINTRDKKFPYVPLFEGELGKSYSEDEMSMIPHKLRDFLDIYIRKCDYLIPVNMEKAKVNPYVEMEVLEGPNKGKLWRMEKNLIY